MSKLTSVPSPRVSVVTIFFNAQPFLAEAIESVLAQTYADYELVLVDDGSSDGSSEVARQYAEQYPDRIHYAEHEGHANLGMSASRNFGVALSRGRLISFLDADDIWLPNRLEKYVDALEAFPGVGMVYGPTLYWYSWDKSSPQTSSLQTSADFSGTLMLPAGVEIQPPEALRLWLDTTGACLPGMGSLLLRRKVFDEVKGFEVSFRDLFEDQVFLSKVALAYPVTLVSEVLDYYRQHSQSCCERALSSGEYHPTLLNPARERYLNWLESYCDLKAIDHPDLRRALVRQLWPYRSRVGGMVHRTRTVLLASIREALRRRLPGPAWGMLRRTRQRYYKLRQARVREGKTATDSSRLSGRCSSTMRR